MLAATTILTGSTTVAVSTPAAAAGYCGQGWQDSQTVAGGIKIDSGLRTGAVLSCHINAIAYTTDAGIIFDCTSAGWTFVDDEYQQHARGWVPNGNLYFYEGLPGSC